MSELIHRIKVFVFQWDDAGPSYLLLRPDRGPESAWGPVQGPVRYDEKLEAAVQREVARDTGIQRPLELIDLAMPVRWRLGDEEIVEWTFGYKATGQVDPDVLAAERAAFRWAGFQDAYPALELEPDRAAILRLHAKIRAA